MTRYDSSEIGQFYDGYGEREWDRLELDPAGRASFHIHAHYLRKHVRSGDRVLEVGAGSGRFTMELAFPVTIVSLRSHFATRS